MEYNYTREFKQPNKIYAFPGGYPIPMAPNGIRLEHIVVGGVFFVLALVLAIISFVKGISFLQSLFANYWLVIIVVIGILVWSLFSLKWDNKSFLDYILGRGNYQMNKNKKYEHTMLVFCFQKKVTYAPRKRRK
jgi:hypothetical protein